MIGSAAERPLRRDLVAGITVALIGIPQCLAYAMLAGLPPSYGLTTAVVPGLVAAIAGKSPHVATGPTNTTGLLVLVAMTPFLGEGTMLPSQAIPILATLTFLVGVMRLAGAIAGGAKLLRFLPESVLIGFYAGAGLLIAAMQLDEALGLPPLRASTVLEEIQALFAHLHADGAVSAPAALTAVATVALCAGLGLRFPRFPAALIAIVAGTAVAAALGLDAEAGLPLVGDRAVPDGWTQLALPTLDPSVVASLFWPAAAIVLLGTLELAATARARGEEADMRREILAHGFANTAGAFAGAFPASASLGRSALLRLSGAETRLAAGVSALAVAPFLLFGGGVLGLIPQASLAGVLFVIAFDMIDRARIAKMWNAAPETRLLMMTTLAGTVLFSIVWAILVGALIGLILHLAKTSAPRITLLAPRGDRLVPLAPGATADVVVLEVSGDLHYAAVEAFLEEARALLPASARLVVIDLSHAHALRVAGLDALERLAAEIGARGGALRLAGVDPKFARVARKVESSLCFEVYDPEPGASVRRALDERGARVGPGA